MRKEAIQDGRGKRDPQERHNRYRTCNSTWKRQDGYSAAADGVEEAWERAIQRYRRRLAKIGTRFPSGWKRFRKDHVLLHDARLLSLARQNTKMMFVLQQEPPSHDIVVLTFVLDGEPEIDRAALPGRQARSFITWMYEEFDIDRNAKCCFEVLLSNGWAVKLRFKDFRYAVGHTILPEQNGQLVQSPVRQPA